MRKIIEKINKLQIDLRLSDIIGLCFACVYLQILAILQTAIETEGISPTRLLVLKIITIIIDAALPLFFIIRGLIFQ